jgi:hypothetical protein
VTNEEQACDLKYICDPFGLLAFIRDVVAMLLEVDFHHQLLELSVHVFVELHVFLGEHAIESVFPRFSFPVLESVAVEVGSKPVFSHGVVVVQLALSTGFFEYYGAFLAAVIGNFNDFLKNPVHVDSPIQPKAPRWRGDVEEPIHALGAIGFASFILEGGYVDIS